MSWLGRWVMGGVAVVSLGCTDVERAATEGVGVLSSALSWQGLPLTRDEPARYSGFGFATATNGEVVAVGAYLEAPTGAVYLFEKVGAAWSESQKLTIDEGVSDFGRILAMQGDTLVVGTTSNESAYVFVQQPDGRWVQQQRLIAADGGDRFGDAVAVDGDTIAVGAWADDDASLNAGAAYVFTRSQGVWSEQQKLTVQTSTPLWFGSSVAVSGDTVLVGTWPTNTPYSVHFFERTAGVWGPPRSIEAPQPETLFGLAVAIDGDTAVVGASTDDDVQQAGGAVHVYHRVGGDWVEQPKLIPDGVQSGERFGFSVAVSGQNVVAGAWGRTHMEVDLAGAAYAFSRVDGQWQGSKDLPPSLRSDDDRLGFSVAASGSLAVAGAPYYSSVKGAAFVFEAQCSADQDCQGGEYCASDHRCTSSKPLGAACQDSAGADCAEAGCRVCLGEVDRCVDGFCCEVAEQACGACSACAAALTGQANGKCAPVAGGKDPHEVCQAVGQGDCGADGACDGAGACRSVATAGTACGATTCAADQVSGSLCNGAGACEATTLGCAPYRCGGDACAQSCEGHESCADSAHCSAAGTCEPDEPLGSACEHASECSSGQCVDGVCCESSCDGQCEACAEAGSEGSCVAVSGAPRGERGACAGQGACAGECDGEQRRACSLPAVGTECAVECRGATTRRRTCDDTGACVLTETVACAPYGCAPDDSCRSDCEDASHCAPSHDCAAGRCYPFPEEEDPQPEEEEDEPVGGAGSVTRVAALSNDNGGCAVRPKATGGASSAALLFLLAMGVFRRSRGGSRVRGR